jgi:hypothetical protein
MELLHLNWALLYYLTGKIVPASPIGGIREQCVRRGAKRGIREEASGELGRGWGERIERGGVRGHASRGWTAVLSGRCVKTLWEGVSDVRGYWW